MNSSSTGDRNHNIQTNYLNSSGKKEKDCNDVFFLQKAERMLVTMQKLLPERRFLIVWEDRVGNKEFLEVKNQ